MSIAGGASLRKTGPNTDQAPKGALYLFREILRVKCNVMLFKKCFQFIFKGEGFMMLSLILNVLYDLQDIRF